MGEINKQWMNQRGFDEYLKDGNTLIFKDVNDIQVGIKTVIIGFIIL